MSLLRRCLAPLLLLAGLGAALPAAWATTIATTACPPGVQAAPPAPPGVTRRDRGYLWRVSRDGRISWLFGTLHVGKPAWQRLGPQVANALRASDVLALEIDPGDPALLAALAEIRPPDSLPAAVQARLFKAYQRACVAAESLAALHPVLQATTLVVLEARWLGMDPLFALEQTLGQQARSLGRQVVALETVAQQKAALVPHDNAEALLLLEQTLTQLEDQSGRRVMGRLAQAWESGDLQALEDYDRWCECAATDAERAFMRKLNDERNPLLADGIEVQHQQGQRVFAAVGALHMTGPQSLPLLLERRGFKVERINFGR